MSASFFRLSLLFFYKFNDALFGFNMQLLFFCFFQINHLQINKRNFDYEAL